MLRNILLKTTRHKKITEFLEKYKIPKEYFAANRKMISKGVLIGLFIAFIPMPMQMAAVVAVTPFTKFNVPIAIAMCWLSNPFTMPPMYYMEYLTGSYFLGIEPEPVELTLEWFKNNLSKIFIPLYVGTAFYSVFGSIGGYYLVNWLWGKSVKKQREKNN
jgi:uncharacterized protein (DUF2062 family)